MAVAATGICVGSGVLVACVFGAFVTLPVFAPTSVFAFTVTVMLED